MNRKIVSGMMLTLLLISVSASAFNIQSVKAEPRTWTVDDDGPADFDTIQEAIDAASDGDTIFVYNGTYEPVAVDKALSLVGEDRSITIIEGSLSDPYDGTVSVLADDVNITGFTIRKSSQSGIDIGPSDFLKRGPVRVNVSNNCVSDCIWGITLYNCNRIIIADNIVTRIMHAGIACSFSTNCQITNNTITNNFGYGIFDSGGEPGAGIPALNTIRGNTITCNNIGVCLRALEDTLRNNVIAGNTKAGIKIWGGNNITFFHNSFFNKKQVVVDRSGVNIWDDGYPSGGNYWSDYTWGDEFSGSNQDQLGSDGIGDEPYIIDEDNRDRYPLVTPFLIHEHDLASSVWAPDKLVTGMSTTLEATVYNLGLNNETDVELQLRVNDVVVDSNVISELASGTFFNLNYLWIPAVEGIYNITAYVASVPCESNHINNIMSIIVNVYTSPTEPTMIYLSPSESHTPMDRTFTIDVMVADVEDLGAWQIRLYFDNTMLKCTEDMVWYPENHVFAGKNISPLPPIIGEDENGAYIQYGCCLFGREETTFYGTGTLCRINFTATAVGWSALEFSKPYGIDTFLLNHTEKIISAEMVDGEVTVIEYITGDLNRDGIVNIKDLFTAAEAFGSYPDHPRWNPMADVDGDDKVNIRDLFLVAKNFGKTI